MMRMFIAAYLLLQPWICATGQNPLTKTTGTAHPAEESRKLVSYFWAENGGLEQQITGAPFSATAVIETTQQLADGNRFVTHSTQSLARDSQGRTRREQAIRKIGALQMEGPTMIFIYDPVAKLQYSLDPEQHTARISKLKTIPLAGVPDSAPTSFSRQEIDRRVTRESLGTKVIDGVTCKGTRTTVDFAAGVAGNQRPFTVSAEVWYSPEIHADILRIRKDPRVGETSYHLTHIQRAEPVPSLFQVPPGYKIISKSGKK